ncbi:phosphatase PAP2 family protein [Burkholderiaceae bacterium FT117]|uniref:phosphatase PAP2 family protein n=1 Tax=Zeimonas sediminis TaxID=2944268 RepID=UPI002342C465|nr:phosphatase PAP2 family protein [Zeimonas sediminis]MCM5570600.1 phosphatase PAP2 family protein [Zeimonas sediminis]
MSRSGALVVFAVAATVLAALASYVALGAPFAAAELRLIAWARAAVGPAGTGWLEALSAAHAAPWVMGAAGVLALALAWRRELRATGWLLAVVVGGAALNALLKHAFERARPSFDALAPRVGDYAFPSGHAANVTLLYGAIVVLLACRARNRAVRATVAAVAVAMVLAVAASRVVLGAHYPTDVVAGVAEGLAWLVLCTLVMGEWPASSVDGARPAARDCAGPDSTRNA